MCRMPIKGSVYVTVHTFQYFATGKAIIREIDQKCNSAAFSDPPFLQKADYGDYIKLTEFTVMCRSHGQEEEESSANLTYTVSPTSEASPTQPRQVKLAGLKPGKKYKLTVTAHYSSGESIPSEPQVFSTKPAGVCMFPTTHDFSMQACQAWVHTCYKIASST